jgi:hypothetical protein
VTPKEQKAMAFMITEIREHMSERDFQRDFFESMADQFEASGSLSAKQKDCLFRIHERVTG